MRIALLFLLLANLASAQVLVTLNLMDPAECKPLGGPGCQKAVPAFCDATNHTPEEVVFTAVHCRTLMALNGIVSTRDVEARAIWLQRSKDEAWGKASRWVNYIQLPLVGLGAALGGVRGAFGALGGTEWLEDSANRAQSRAPQIQVNADNLMLDTAVLASNGGTGTVTAWASTEQVKALTHEKRTAHEWFVAGVPQSIKKDMPPPSKTHPAVEGSFLETQPVNPPLKVSARCGQLCEEAWVLAKRSYRNPQIERWRIGELAWRIEYAKWQDETYMNAAEAASFIEDHARGEDYRIAAK